MVEAVAWTFLGALVAVEFVTPAYYILMRWAVRKRRKPLVSYSPTVTIVMPTYNEEATIRQRLENLASIDYDNEIEIIVADSSSDDTAEIARAFAASHPNLPIRVLDVPHDGKVFAVRAALPLARGDLVSITDADTLWDQRALKEATARFSDPQVGAVMGRRGLISGGGPAADMEEDYNAFYNLMRLGESTLDSTPVCAGPMFVFRRKLVPPDAFAAEAYRADDSETAIRIRKQGYRIVVEPRAVFYEMGLSDPSDYRKIRARRVTGLQQLFLQNIPMMLQPWRYGWFSLILAANLGMMVLSPVATVLLAAALPLVLWSLGGFPALLAGAAGLSAFALLAKHARVPILRLPIAYLQTQVAMLQGLWMLRDRKNAQWEQVTSVRERWRQRRQV